MSDGSRLRRSWTNALSKAETHFRQLLTSPSSDWKRVANAGDASTNKKGKARMSAIPDITDIVVHRNVAQSREEIYRLILDIPTGEELASLESWKAVLTTPELRSEWDPAVEESHMLELFDPTTRISRTNFALGWPANPRDAVTISRCLSDPSAIIDITTSLPRSADEPTYLRPSPPFVRSHVTLFAWCIQCIQPQSQPQQPPTPSSDQPRKKALMSGRIRITCFWQHDLKALWGLGSSTSLVQQLSTMTIGLLKTVLKRGNRIPRLIGYGNGVTISKVRFQNDREALTVEYSIIPDEEDSTAQHDQPRGMDDVHAIREQRRLTRSIECVLPASEGWDVQVTTRASSEEVEKLPWTAQASRKGIGASSSQQPSFDQILLRLSHAALTDDHSVLKVKAVIELSGPSSGLRLNGISQTIREVEERDPSSYSIPEQILQDVSSAIDLSFNSTTSVDSGTSTSSTPPPLGHRTLERTPAAEKSILSRVRRNYIYFSSLLQEPEAKWRRTTEGRGVSITQLDSIDPTLVVYRAEATFVGVGLWDLYGVLVTPGARVYWDKQHEDAVLLEDVNELTELWHYKTKPAWPVNGRDSVVLRTVYKSPTTIHVFAFSTEETQLFSNIPSVEPNFIRTQVDLQGWAIEALSPTTTLLTLLEQSDPKGWTNKTSIPTQMINLLAGIGEFAIKCGGPPIVTRLSGAKANELRYDHERTSFRIEYEASAARRPSNTDSGEAEAPAPPVVECEIRCDLDTWAPSLDIVVDPPPQMITCLRRHRISAEGGGLWLSMTHDVMYVEEDRLQVIVRRAPGKEKGIVMVNGAKVPVDVEELSEQEIKALAKQKRVKPPRIPLDQPPVMNVIRKRRAEWDADQEGGSSNSDANNGKITANTAIWASAPRLSSPLARFFTYAMDQATATTQQAVAAIAPVSNSGNGLAPSSSRLPMQYVLDALSWTQETHATFPGTGWDLVGEKGLPIHKKVVPEISPVIPVHKGFKVIEGVSAEELATVIMEPDCRQKWDDRYDSSFVLESFGGECKTSFVVSKTGFPWRDRGFYVASVMARAYSPSGSSRRGTVFGGVMAEQSNNIRNAIYCVSASFSPDSVALFSPAKYNSYSLPIGRVYIDAWILETLDPYTKENYAIPSTRCTRLVAFDYAGSIPAAVNAMINSTLPRSILAIETFIKGISPLPVTRLPTPSFVITERKPDEHLATTAWKLKLKDDHRYLLSTSYSSEDRVYRSTVLVHAPSLPSSSAAVASPAVPAGNEKASVGSEQTPRPSMLRLSPPPSDRPRARDASPEIVSPQPSTASSAQSDATVVPGLSPLSSSPTASQFRPRTVSTTSASASEAPSLRGRLSTSPFTAKGEVRPVTDLLVAELVVDSKLYPDGYDVMLKSRMKAKCLVGVPRGEYVPLSRPSLTGSECPSDVLPLAWTIYTMPSSPLHSSGLHESASPTRHLIRLTLPTAQYQISTVQDPLTGEMHEAPPIPPWLSELQDKGAIIDIEIRPVERKDRTVHGSGKGAVAGTLSKGSKRARIKVRVNGSEAAVVGEKESLTTLGRDELLDDRVSKMMVLSRMPSETDPLPDDLKNPLAIADDLLDPSATSSATVDAPIAVLGDAVPERSEADAHGKQPANEEAPSPSTLNPRVNHAASTSGGLLGFWHAYNNPLTRFTTGSSAAGVGATGSLTDAGTGSDTTAKGEASDSKAATARPLPGGLGDVDGGGTALLGQRRLYPLSTVLIAALIAFLIGSLLRSLLSPADFVYFATDARGTEETHALGGWREIRRLLEIKWPGGGWDVQLAVVRRH